MLGWYILLGLACLLLLIALTPLRLSLAYRRDGTEADDRLTIEISAWFRLLRYRYEVPVLKLFAGKDGPEMAVQIEDQRKQTAKQVTISLSDVKKQIEKFQQLQRTVRDLRETLRNMMRNVRCEEIAWHTQLGFAEAASTGALTGLVWGIKSAIITCFSHYISLRTVPRLSVQPVWNGEVIQTQFRCILRFQLGHALVTGLRILLRWKKGRRRKWQVTPSRA